jgi:hypothetical protein
MHISVYVDRRDWWIGYYRGDDYNYVCPLPCLVVKWPRKPALCKPCRDGDHGYCEVCPCSCGSRS